MFESSWKSINTFTDQFIKIKRNAAHLTKIFLFLNKVLKETILMYHERMEALFQASSKPF